MPQYSFYLIGPSPILANLQCKHTLICNIFTVSSDIKLFRKFLRVILWKRWIRSKWKTTFEPKFWTLKMRQNFRIRNENVDQFRSIFPDRRVLHPQAFIGRTFYKFGFPKVLIFKKCLFNFTRQTSIKIHFEILIFWFDFIILYKISTKSEVNCCIKKTI